MVHVVLISGYKEPLEVMVQTLDTWKAQTQAKRILLLVAFEERTPDFEGKSAKIRQLYSDSFLHLMITRHPYGVPGEIPGKKASLQKWSVYSLTSDLWFGFWVVVFCVHRDRSLGHFSVRTPLILEKKNK